LLREDPIEQFKQLTWRPRPPTLLSKEEQKKIRKTLREYSKTFDEQDFNKKNLANKAVIDHRRRLLEEWRAWRTKVEETLVFKPDAEEDAQEEEGEVIENLEEEVIDETEEIVQ
jgi:translation initiation factor 3 subunit B